KKGQLAKPPALVGVVGHGQAPCGGGHPRVGRLWPSPFARGLLDAARASKAVPAGATAPWQGNCRSKGSRRLCSDDSDSVVRVREEG
ncbi:hypothetical protein GW17_00048860, partial [Ensete ventricosum]